METHTVAKVPLVRMSIVRDILFFAEQHGVDRKLLLLEAGIRMEDFENPDLMLSHQQVDTVWQAAIHATENVNLGLEMGSHTHPGVLGLTGHLYQSCPHLLEAMRCLERFNDLFGNTIQLSVVERGDCLGLKFHPLGSVGRNFGARQALDAWMSAVRYVFEKAGAARPRPILVQTTCINETRRSAYELHFSPAQVELMAAENIVWYKREDVEAPQITSDPELYRHFLAMAREKLEAQQGGDSALSTVRELLISTFNQGFHGIEFIADKMHMTPRTLQRRLQAQGYTFSQILEETKQDMSFKLLKSKQYSVSEIAYMLGFSEPGSFSRSFRKWTGTTPKHFMN